MIRSLLIGLAAGPRSMTPLAVVSEAARRGALPADNGAPSWLGHPWFAAGSKAIAVGEVWGDKLRSAPDRIVWVGLAARVASGGLAGAALAPRRRALANALLGAAGALGSAYLSFAIRMRAMQRFGQTPTGLVEDALTVSFAVLVVATAASRSANQPLAAGR